MICPKFQETEPNDSEEEEFEYFSMYFYGSDPGPPGMVPF